MAVSSNDVRAVQSFYPRIYLACHTRHVRRATTSAQLTEHESSVLGHMHEQSPIRASDLARHLGVSRSTMSATIMRLVKLGYLARARDERDGRAASLRLSPEGARAMQAGSVLETGRVKAMLARLNPADRRRAIAGLELLARAAAALPKKQFQPWR
jgi:DNA-binding MarR family transcriptional regulator